LILIRRNVESDAIETWGIFFNTVRNINSRDYSEQQVKAWAPRSFDFALWQKKMDSINPFIAEINGVVVGKALMTHILNCGSKKNIHRYYSEVSITAKPFYEHFGFKVVKAQNVEIRGQTLTNYIMEKIS
jgi:putative acetyltransferase